MNGRADCKGTLIIGYGNSLRRDDAVGLLAAGRLSGCGYNALAVAQLTPELACPIAEARSVVFVDADVAVAAGDVAVVRVDSSSDEPAPGHFAGPAGLLRLAREVYGATPEAWLVSLGGRDYDLGHGVTFEARRAVRRAVREVRRLCA